MQLRPDQRLMVQTGWLLLGGMMAIDVGANCVTGASCWHPGTDGLLSRYLGGLVLWLLESGSAFLLVVWLVASVVLAARRRRG
jgi:hypothetical protein